MESTHRFPRASSFPYRQPAASVNPTGTVTEGLEAKEQTTGLQTGAAKQQAWVAGSGGVSSRQEFVLLEQPSDCRALSVPASLGGRQGVITIPVSLRKKMSSNRSSDVLPMTHQVEEPKWEFPNDLGNAEYLAASRTPRKSANPCPQVTAPEPPCSVPQLGMQYFLLYASLVSFSRSVVSKSKK